MSQKTKLNKLRNALMKNIEARANNKKKAAVLVPIFYEKEIGLILVKRTEKVFRHSGEISFPGGLIEKGETPKEAALREAMEEIGINPKDVEILGFLEPTETKSTGFIIYPLVGIVPRNYNFVINKGEVERIIFITISELVKNRKRTILGNYYKKNGYVIWGATARIIDRLISIFEKISLMNTF